MEIANLFINASDLKLQPNELGIGPHGTVYIVEAIEDNTKYVAKIINIENNFDGNEQGLFIKESLTMKNLNHPAIAKFYGINFMSLVDPTLHKPTIFTNYFPNGSLKDIFDDEKNGISKQYWTSTKKYINLLGICDALRYLHDQKIIHFNLKPENILFDSDYNPQVCDYYQLKCFPKMYTYLTNQGQFEKSIYLAPEIFQGDDDYNESVDVYAFSMIAYQIITEKVPYGEITDFSSLKNDAINVHHPKFPESVPQKMQDLLSRCWSDKPYERPTFNEIFSILSGDMISSFEKVDANEVHKYIEMINNSKKEQKIINEKSNIEEKIDDLKSTMFFCFGKCASEYHDKLMKFFYKEAVKTNNKDILYEIGSNYLYSKLCTRNNNDYYIAKNCCDRAVELGSLKAFENLGDIYYYGYGVKKDYSKALYYYEKAYNSGNINVCKNLGDIYQNGYGVKKNHDKANEYYKIGRRNKDEVYIILMIHFLICFIFISIVVKFM